MKLSEHAKNIFHCNCFRLEVLLSITCLVEDKLVLLQCKPQISIAKL